MCIRRAGRLAGAARGARYCDFSLTGTATGSLRTWCIRSGATQDLYARILPFAAPERPLYPSMINRAFNKERLVAGDRRPAMTTAAVDAKKKPLGGAPGR